MEILYQYWPLNCPINLLNIDVEGHEIEVLLSNNWEKYVPEWIIIEVFHTSIESLPQYEFNKYLKRKGYSCIHILDNSIILKKCNDDIYNYEL